MTQAKTDVDLTEFFKLSRPKRRPCAVGFALTQIKPAEQRQLHAAAAADSGIITATAIQEWLKTRDLEASIPAITTHRTGKCTCHD